MLSLRRVDGSTACAARALRGHKESGALRVAFKQTQRAGIAARAEIAAMRLSVAQKAAIHAKRARAAGGGLDRDHPCNSGFSVKLF